VIFSLIPQLNRFRSEPASGRSLAARVPGRMHPAVQAAQVPVWVLFAGLSGLTNYCGLSLLWSGLPAAAGAFALALGVCVLGYWYSSLADDTPREGRRAIGQAWAAFAALSIFFSYAGIEHAISQSAWDMGKAPRAEAALRDATAEFVQKVAALRTTALRELANESSYVRGRLARARAQTGAALYVNPADGIVAEAQLVERLDQITTLISDWKTFETEIPPVGTGEDPKSGWSRLASIHNDLVILAGQTRGQGYDLSSVDLPDAPVAPEEEGKRAAAGLAHPVLGPIVRFLPPGPLQVFALLTGASFDVLPFLLARGGRSTRRRRRGSSGDDDSDADGDDGDDGDGSGPAGGAPGGRWNRVDDAFMAATHRLHRAGFGAIPAAELRTALEAGVRVMVRGHASGALDPALAVVVDHLKRRAAEHSLTAEEFGVPAAELALFVDEVYRLIRGEELSALAAHRRSLIEADLALRLQHIEQVSTLLAAAPREIRESLINASWTELHNWLAACSSSDALRPREPVIEPAAGPRRRRSRKTVRRGATWARRRPSPPWTPTSRPASAAVLSLPAPKLKRSRYVARV